jgi:metal-sulfur cluster biosynthetic enzyme
MGMPEERVQPKSDTKRSSDVVRALRGVVDPEIGLDIVDLGLVYDVRVEGATAHVRMTLTTPSCPFGGQLARDAAEAIRKHVPEVTTVDVALVWDPPWSADRLSPHAKEILGWGS